MATKRPIANQKISAESTKATTEVIQAVPSEVNAVTDPEIVESAEQPSEEQAAAEATTERVDLGEARKGPTPGTTVGVADDPAEAGADSASPGADDERPSEAELKEQLFDTGLGGGEPDQDPAEPGSGQMGFGGKEGLMQTGGSASSGHPGAYVIKTNSDGEVVGSLTVADPFMGGFFQERAEMKAYEAEQNEKADEAHAARLAREGAAGANPSGSTSGSAAPSDPSVIHEQDNPDGSHTTVYNDGDGTIVTTYADGTQIVNTKDGSKSYNADGTEMTPEQAAQHQAAKKAEAEAAKKKAEEEAAAQEEAAEEEEAESTESQPAPDGEGGPPTEEEIAARQAIHDQLGYSKRHPDDGATDPTDDDAAFGAGVGTAVPTGVLAQGKEGLIGQPAGPDMGTGGGGGVAGNPLSNEILVENTPAQFSGREQDPFDRRQETLEPPAETDSSEDSGDDGNLLPGQGLMETADDVPDLGSLIDGG